MPANSTTTTRPIHPNEHAACSNRWLRVAVALLIGAIITFAESTATAAETWTDNTGMYQVVGDFLALRDGDVYLRKENGVTIRVPMSRLNAASQQKARQMAAALAADTAPDVAVRAMMGSLQSGEFRALWDSLPSSYQTDINEVFQTFGQNMDADIWNAGKRVVGKLFSVLKDKKEFLLGYPALQQPGMDMTVVNKNWDAVVGLLDTIFRSDLTDLNKLKSFDGGAFMDGTGKEIGARLVALAKALDADIDPDNPPIPMEFPGLEAIPRMDFTNIKISTVQVDGDLAVLRFEQADGQVEEQQAIRVEGKWLPKEMVDDWKDNIEQAKMFLTTIMPGQLKEGKPMLLSPLSPVKMFEGVLDQLLAANDQEAFNEVIEGIMEMVGGMFGAGEDFEMEDFEMEEEGMVPFGVPGDEADDPFEAPPGGAAGDAADPFGT